MWCGIDKKIKNPSANYERIIKKTKARGGNLALI
jgi:hypothetical protein